MGKEGLENQQSSGEGRLKRISFFYLSRQVNVKPVLGRFNNAHVGLHLNARPVNKCVDSTRVKVIGVPYMYMPNPEYMYLLLI